MRQQPRNIHSYLSAWQDQASYKSLQPNLLKERKNICLGIILFFKANQKTIEISALILGFGALFLGGSYFFLHQLAHYGW